MNERKGSDPSQKLKPGRKPNDEISETQLKTLKAINKHVSSNGYPPTATELGELLGITNASAHEQINQLVRKGYLKREAGKARGLSVVRKPISEPISLVSVPIIGKVAAGSPIFAEENVTGEILFDSALASKGKLFALEVQGDSMVDADIRNGDILIVRQQPLSDSGDIVVALLGDEATVKRLYIGEESIELRPENPRYQTIVIEPDDDMRIVGKVVAVRHLN